jgi:hypothetical protein
MNSVEYLRSCGYPLKIIGNDGYKAILVGIQPLTDGNFEALYRYPGGVCCHDLDSINKYFKIIER